MKQKTVIRGKRGKKPAIRQPKKFDPIPAQWWRPKGSDGKESHSEGRSGH